VPYLTKSPLLNRAINLIDQLWHPATTIMPEIEVFPPTALREDFFSDDFSGKLVVRNLPKAGMHLASTCNITVVPY